MKIKVTRNVLTRGNEMTNTGAWRQEGYELVRPSAARHLLHSPMTAHTCLAPDGATEQTTSRVTAAGGLWAEAPKKGSQWGAGRGDGKVPGTGRQAGGAQAFTPPGSRAGTSPSQSGLTREEVPERKVTGAGGRPCFAATTFLPPT